MMERSPPKARVKGGGKLCAVSRWIPGCPRSDGQFDPKSSDIFWFKFRLLSNVGCRPLRHRPSETRATRALWREIRERRANSW